MVFNRRNRRTPLETLRNLVYPRGGFTRAAQYVAHRLRRLQDEPHRVARGIFAGVFASFTPFLGLHFLVAALLAWLLRANILAAVLATFVGNPLTTPFIAYVSVTVGHRLLGIDAPLDVGSLIAAFVDAGAELWSNMRAMFTPEPTQWGSLAIFARTIFWPYLVGGLLPGLVVGLGFYWATIPIVRAYQKIRAGRASDRMAKRGLLAARNAPATLQPPSGDDDGPAAP